MAKKIKYEIPEAEEAYIDGINVTKFGNETIRVANIADEAEEYIKLFGANKNVFRAIPNLQSGLKPGAQRFLWAWWSLDGKPQSTDPSVLKKLKYHKAAILTTRTMEFHPHSDSGISSMLGTMGQTFSNNVMLIVPQGSYGNLQYSDAGAERYIEAKLSEFTIDCYFEDFYKYCIPMRKNYLGEEDEPITLYSKYPVILFNPQFSSMGYGMASNIPPYNVKEVLEATIDLIKNPKKKIFLIPDFPSGCDIIDEGQFQKIVDTGKGKFSVQGSYTIDYTNNTIHFSSVPLNTKTKKIIMAIIELKKSKHLFDEIVKIDDETIGGNVDLTFTIKHGENPEKVLDKLFKKNTGLKKPFPVGITVIDDYEIVTNSKGDEFISIKDLLLRWIDYRREALRVYYLRSLQINVDKTNMNDVLLMVFSKDNIDDTIKIAKKSKNRKETVEKYMERFNINSIQAETIADMHVYNFNKDSYERYKSTAESLKEEYKKIMNILESDDEIDKIIIEQLEYGIKKYGGPRRSKVIKPNNSEIEENIPDIDYLIGISENGYIKKIKKKDNNSIGPVSKSNNNISVLSINNRENVLVIDSRGTVSKVSISAIPEMKFSDIGVELSKFFTVRGDIKAMMELPSSNVLKNIDDDMYIIFITKKGICKKVLVSEFGRLSTKSGISLDEDDEVACATFAIHENSKDIIIYTNKGDGIRIPISEIREYKANAKGLSMISLTKDEYVVGASKINPKKNILIYITSTGKAKLTELKLFPKMNRNDSPLKLISMTGNETLVGIESVGKNDTLILYKKSSDPEEIKISSINLKPRMSSGDKVSSLKRGDYVVAYKIFS